MEAALAPEELGRSDFAQTYPAVPGSVAAIRRALVQFARDADVPAGTAAAIALAASEATTNIVLHAYRGSAEPGTIDVIGARHDDHVVVTVRDSGTGLRARGDSPGLGLGLAIIAQSVDRLDVLAPPDGGVEVRMSFAVTPAAPG
jgi:serine/threonine-protein kinase RsbW